MLVLVGHSCVSYEMLYSNYRLNSMNKSGLLNFPLSLSRHATPLQVQGHSRQMEHLLWKHGSCGILLSLGIAVASLPGSASPLESGTHRRPKIGFHSKAQLLLISSAKFRSQIHTAHNNTEIILLLNKA
ncbi:hypothetical protein Y1Q_0022148 [Alligator mississippiensis]|uniref:Uncharacterized protein n=1 Tax=Alligator mississippiensis TaxID=8496 RepID=A0A151NZG9_ALLMI|nr:hypothetical protein Y1Q_0022148 [Alligator mississippiensis]